MLGVREPETYGSQTLANLEQVCLQVAKDCGLSVECRQSNHEGELVAWVQESRNKHGGIVLTRNAHADVMGNTISANGGDGVNVSFGSGVNFDSAPRKDGPNQTAAGQSNGGVAPLRQLGQLSPSCCLLAR